jgi:CheY-like chemotaxis protein
MTPQEADAPIDVLIADDDAELRHSVRLLLEGQGYRCAEAADGREAVDLALRHAPRCMLLDLTMPKLDGLAVARTLRADPRTRGAHIHCVSGLRDPNAPQQARAAGCDRYLTKPIDPDALLEAVRGPEPEGRVSGLTLVQAEELLDWLQNHGCTGLQLVREEGHVTVRFECPPGLRLVRDADGRARLERG